VSVVLSCAFCMKQFEVPPAEAKSGRRWCSNKCRGAGRTTSVEQRFWMRVQKTESCWIWTGSLDSGGYGYMFDGSSKMEKAHRLSWMIHNGVSAGEMCVCHKCDVRNCVNPDHLFLGTLRDNVEDMRQKGRASKGENHYASKLKEDDVLAIRRLYADGGLTFKSIGDKFSVSDEAVRNIVHRITWKHI